MARKLIERKKEKIKSELGKDYLNTFVKIKEQIKESQVKAILAANKELIKLYWFIGKVIVQKQKESKWGTKIIEKLAKDLQQSFPSMGGFSRANLYRMMIFFSTYEIVAQAARQLEDLPFFNVPWFHNVVIMQKLKNNQDRIWYAKKAIEHGWSRSILEMQIESNLHLRQGKAITNFSKTLPVPCSDLAQQSLKDPYVFDFLTLHDEHVERDIEQGMIENVQKLLLELGKGFSFIARQYHLEVGNKDFYIDLLFYHFKLRCFVVIELKAKEFDPRDAGQLNFYLSAIDDQLKSEHDNPTIGLLLCQTKDNIVAEYALRDINKPMGVAGYQTEITKKLPKNLKSSLPTIQEIESEFEKQEFLAKKSKSKVDKRVVIKKKKVK
ncbi:PDDEXK nuclease domain-containing protein, partial [Candidatus Babeliales bacterium]|nr:PDDEXK nuclease domain-containing protein [Candidatus Babeliales bacterium]MCF7899328.1 PDDEXK nuclease domain-containing protein [Candidatus Babeliales bacterium]